VGRSIGAMLTGNEYTCNQYRGIDMDATTVPVYLGLHGHRYSYELSWFQ